MDVQLYVYDLSQGLARQMSQQFLGIQIDAVYHTAIIIDGIEYFFGAGIQSCRAGTTHHGRPMEIIPLGTTQLPKDVIAEYLQSLSSVYTAESYDLFMHNCNNFSNDFAMFLVGRNIPDHITSLPATVLNTPFGQMLRPMLDQSMRRLTQAPVPNQSLAPQNGIAAAPVTASKVRNIQSLSELETTLSSAKKNCAVIFFTSSTCGPCKVLYPVYDELAAAAGEKAILIKVDINYAQEIASKYSVRATPTIMTFLNGEKEDEWAGADVNRLRSSVERLTRMAHPLHPHHKFEVGALVRAASAPVKYGKIPPLDKLLSKLGEAAKAPIVNDIKQFIAGLESASKQDNPLPSLPSFAAFLNNSLETVPSSSLFAVYDLLRTALIDFRVAAFFAEPANASTITTLINHVLELASEAPYNLRIVSLQLSCNLLSARVAASLAEAQTELLYALVRLARESLPDTEHATARVAAAGLAFNIAATNQVVRAQKGKDALDEDVQVELVAAISEALAAESGSKEVITGLVMALGLLVYMAPVDSEVMDLMRTLEVGSVLDGKKKIWDKSDAAISEAVNILEKGLNVNP